jgi:DNA-binding transcriptional LysR family regulator
MNFDRLKHFCAIVETQNLRKAGELLHITPGALSKSMQNLRHEVGFELIATDGRRLLITDEGKNFYFQCKKIVNDIESLKRSISGPAPRESIRIASFEPFTVYFISEMIAKHFDRESFLVLERIPGQMEQALLTREADFGITYAPIPHPELEFLKICTVQKRIFAKKGAFEGWEFSKIPFAAPTTPVPQSPSGVTNFDGWPSKISRNLVYELEMLEATLELCRKGLVAVFTYDYIVRLQNEKLKPEFKLQALPFPTGMSELQRHVYIIKRRTDPESLALKKLARALRQICG